MVETNCKKLRQEILCVLSKVSECPEFEADQICMKIGNLTKAELLLGEKEFSEELCQEVWRLVKKRTEGMPLQYLLGEWEFFGRRFFVGKGVLIPRPETEILAEAALSFAKTHSVCACADLCSGSGCLAITLAKELPQAEITAVELSKEALAWLEKNRSYHTVEMRVCQDDVIHPREEYQKFDLIISNPPYLTGEDMRNLQREVRQEPELALYGGESGLFFYEKITAFWKNFLNPGGMLAYEIGIHQENAVKKIMEENGFFHICFHRDYCDIIRVVSGIKNL